MLTIDKIESLNTTLIALASAAGLLYPTAGAVLTVFTSVITGKLTTSEQERQKQFIEQLINQLAAETDIKIEAFFKSENGEYLFRKCYEAAIREINETKRKAYVNILTNACATPEEFDEINYYLEVLLSLNALEVEMLAFINDPEGFMVLRDIDKSKGQGHPLTIIKNIFPRNKEGEVKLAYKKLYSLGICSVESLGGLSIARDLEGIKNRLTEEGKKLVSYVSEKR